MNLENLNQDIPVDKTDIERAQNMAKAIAKNSKGAITERQALAAILFKGSSGTISFLSEDLSGDQVSEIMGISTNSVYKAATAGEEKLMAAKIMLEIVEDEPWWATEIRLSEN